MSNFEVRQILTMLIYDGIFNVSNTPKKILDILPDFPQDCLGKVKTVVFHNTSNLDICFSGRSDAASSDCGGLINPGESREIPIVDLGDAPYFFSSDFVGIKIEIWG